MWAWCWCAAVGLALFFFCEFAGGGDLGGSLGVKPFEDFGFLGFPFGDLPRERLLDHFFVLARDPWVIRENLDVPQPRFFANGSLEFC